MGYVFKMTNDGSVGLFDESVNDIYHSESGAYKEALDKFVIPAQLERFKNKKCRVLDICYGIGYNTKALLKYSIENDLNIQFEIDALELNKELIEISPFIKTKNDFLNEVDEFILKSYLDDHNLNFNFIKEQIIKNKNFLTINKPNFYQILQFNGYKYNPLMKINAFLHNIYYHNMAIRLKKGQNSHNLAKNTLKWHINDARKSISALTKEYDIIFLDAFTASKQPILWTYEFLNELVSRLNKETGVLLSYSSASPFRNALKQLGVFVGKYYDDNSEINSTVASYNENLIKYNLDDFEIGLLNTRAGILYHDNNFSLTSDEVIKNRDEEMRNSNLESTSQYYKRNNRKHGEL